MTALLLILASISLLYLGTDIILPKSTALAMVVFGVSIWALLEGMIETAVVVFDIVGKSRGN